VVIQGQRLVSVGRPTRGRKRGVRRVISAKGRLVLPGLIHGHLHACQTLFRNRADGLELLDWLRDPKRLGELTEEQRAMLKSLSLEELRELYRKRLAEQKERHDGGNRWIGTGGTSPFGSHGKNPTGMRVGDGLQQPPDLRGQQRS